MFYEYLKKIHSADFNEIHSRMHNAAISLMQEYHLQINNDTYDITDIEFYYFNTKTHKDPYTHLHCMQLENGKWYVHEKGWTRGGIDYTFGDGRSFGGILIREIQNRQTREFVTGPAKVRQAISSSLKESEEIAHNELQKKINSESTMQLVKHPPEVKSIGYGTRIGLTKKNLCDAEMYKNRCYRFVASIDAKRKNSQNKDCSVQGYESLKSIINDKDTCKESN